MRTEFQNRYKPFVDLNPESRFATREEIRDSGTWIDISEASVGAAGIPLMIEKNHLLIDAEDHHNLILGSTRTGKTRRLILILLHILLKAACSVVVIDVKGELKRYTSGMARELGYKIIDLNLRDFKSGDCWNPLYEPYRLYHSGEQDTAIEMLSDFMSGLAAPKEARNVDPFWPGQAKILGKVITQLMCECLPEHMVHPMNLADIGSEANHEVLERISESIEYTSEAAVCFRGVFSSAEKTRESIEVTFYDMVKIFTENKRVAQMLSRSTFDMHEIGKEKTIVYIEIADEKNTYHQIVSIFIKQLYEVLVGDAKKKKDGSLDIPVHMVMDEFCNIPRIGNMSNMITAAASRNIFLSLVVQSYHQLEGLYGADADTIKGNCQNWYYLFSREVSMLEEISTLCGEIVKITGGRRRLISVSELQRLKMGEVLVMHDRLYPYVGYFPDISEYGFEDYAPIEEKQIKAKKVDIVYLNILERAIDTGQMPVPFSGDIPAVDRLKIRKRASRKAESEDAQIIAEFQRNMDRQWEEFFGGGEG